MKVPNPEGPFDCVIVGAGPGGLQAAIHLARYNHRILLFNRPGGRTWHARHIENYLGLDQVTGPDLVRTGLAQAEHFGVDVLRGRVERIARLGDGSFETHAGGVSYRSRFVIAASGARESLPPLKNIERFFSTSYFTCLICDGYRTTGKKLVVTDRTANGIRIAVGMKQLFTDDVTFLAHGFEPPRDLADLLSDEGIPWIEGRPEELLGGENLEGIGLSDGRTVPCEVVMGWGGISLNDDYLAGLAPERDADEFKIMAGSHGETSVPGLFVVGALRQGHSQAVISAGQGAEAAIEIAARIVEL